MADYSKDTDGYLVETIQPDPVINKYTKLDIQSMLDNNQKMTGIKQAELTGLQQEFDRLTALLKTANDLDVLAQPIVATSGPN